MEKEPPGTVIVARVKARSGYGQRLTHRVGVSACHAALAAAWKRRSSSLLRYEGYPVVLLDCPFVRSVGDMSPHG